MKRAVIFGAAPIGDYSFISGEIEKKDLIICADGGISHALFLGIKPDVIVGDFDSFEEENPFPEARVIKAEKKKDLTDTQIAINEAVRMKAFDLLLIGCIYGRLDQTFANIQLLLKYTRQGCQMTLIGENDILKVVTGSVSIEKKEGFYLSLFALSDTVRDLSIKGTVYELSSYTLTCGDALCVSNEFKEKQALIDFSKGELLIILSKKRR
jgi:thiamine pyrophosphokinase